MSKIKVLIIEPYEKPYVKEVENDLKTLQSIVGGLIESVNIENEVTLICNEEAKIEGLDQNLFLRNDDGSIYDIICGTCFICATPITSEHFESLSDEQIRCFSKQYVKQATVIKINGSTRYFEVDRDDD